MGAERPYACSLRRVKRIVKARAVAVAALAIVVPAGTSVACAQTRACQPAPVVRVAASGFDWSSAAIGAAATAAVVLGSSAVLVRTKEGETK